MKRSGYTFLGNGEESVAEHSFLISFISYIMAKLNPGTDEKKIVLMSLFHDLPEARMGDINYFQKEYVKTNEEKAVNDLTKDLFFGDEIKGLINEFNSCETKEAKLAKDADQLSFLIDLKALKDKGAKDTDKWMESLVKRLVTETGKKLAHEIMSCESDSWWFKIMLTQS